MTRECNYSLVDIQPGRPSSTLQKGLNVVNPQPSEDQKINHEPSKMQSHLSIILYFQLKWRLCIAKKRTMLCLIFGWAKFKRQKFPLYLNRRNGYLIIREIVSSRQPPGHIGNIRLFPFQDDCQQAVCLRLLPLLPLFCNFRKQKDFKKSLSEPAMLPIYLTFFIYVQISIMIVFTRLLRFLMTYKLLGTNFIVTVSS